MEVDRVYKAKLKVTHERAEFYLDGELYYSCILHSMRSRIPERSGSHLTVERAALKSSTSRSNKKTVK
jgi:hypothetical protein